MVIETVLEQACKEFTILLASHRNQVRSLLRKTMKDDNGTLSKLQLIEAISKCLKDNNECLFSSSRLCRGSSEYLDCEGGLESQEEELEVKTAPKFNVQLSLLV
uniref:Uncharacterized protein n=1 Tax=Arundo donax TaxID=35708 RepID=A0A0A9D887_ARUDO